MSTTIDISVGGRSLLDQDAQNRRGSRQAWLERQQDLEVERNAPVLDEGEEEAPPGSKQSKDEPAANRRSKKGMTLLPKYEAFPSPLREDEKLYLFDGPLKKGPAVTGVALQRRFAMSFSTLDDDFAYEYGSFKRVRRLAGGGPKDAPVLDYTMNYEANALTGSTGGYVGIPPNDGLAVVSVFDPTEIGRYYEVAKAEWDQAERKEAIFAWLGEMGLGFAAWQVVTSLGEAGPVPYVIRNLQNVNQSVLGDVVYLPASGEPFPPDRAYLGSRRKTISFYVARLSGPPFKIVFTLGELVLIINHSYWNDFPSERSRLQLATTGETLATLPFNTDNLSGWDQIALSVDQQSYAFYVNGTRISNGPMPSELGWGEASFFPDALEIRQAMWSDVDFGDYMTRVQVSTIRFYQGGYKP